MRRQERYHRPKRESRVRLLWGWGVRMDNALVVDVMELRIQDPLLKEECDECVHLKTLQKRI